MLNFFKDKVYRVKEKDFYRIEDLQKHNKSIFNISIKDKNTVRVLILDDAGYNIEPLKSLGYINVDVKTVFTDMKEIEMYDVIFCDVTDVAKNIYNDGQGAQLASCIKKTYPNKYVVIFSGQTFKPSFSKYFSEVDAVLDKSANYGEITDHIDKCISIQNDPIKYWKFIKKVMTSNELNDITLSKMEHFYVKSIIDHKDYITNMDSNIFSDIDYSIILNFIKVISTVIQTYLSIRR